MAGGEHLTNGPEARDGAPEDDFIARLMRLAGPRPAIPDDTRARVHASVRREWRSAVARRRALRWAIPAAVAAGLLLVAVFGGRLPLSVAPPVATVAMGDARASASGTRLVSGDAVHAGDSLAAGDGGLALAFEGGLSLRAAAHTAATIDGVDEITVSSGRVYSDSGPSNRHDRAMRVHTPVGSATDHGTQFAVGYEDGVMTVAVREGNVQVSAPRASYAADAGQKLTLQTGREAVFDEIAPYDRSWEWAAALAPPFDINERPVIEFLEWAARETGRELTFATDGARLAARAKQLSGSIAGLTPSEAIEAVLPTTRFVARIDDRRMIVTLSE